MPILEVGNMPLNGQKHKAPDRDFSLQHAFAVLDNLGKLTVLLG